MQYEINAGQVAGWWEMEAPERRAQPSCQMVKSC